MFRSNRISARSSDGIDDVVVCDGTHHIRVMLPESDRRAYRASASSHDDCDGSCKSSDLAPQLVQLVMQLLRESFDDHSEILGNDVVVDREVWDLVELNQLNGRKVYSWYCKRGGEGATYRLDDGQTLEVRQSYDWWGCKETGFYKSVEIKILPADQVGMDRLVLENADTARQVDAAIERYKRSHADSLCSPA